MSTEQQLRDEILTDADWPMSLPAGTGPARLATLVGNGLVLLARAIDNRDERHRAIVREELASMGGDLLSTYGHLPDNDPGRTLKTLGGYMLERFGKK
jgi:hypothetical protein